ncbi:TRAP transporter small permease [Hyphomicrobium sp.]|uniref:TRAP transporter small permease n=1 Tax=Hyphomicrobium sp. TaxID=82 RepID=UPI002E33C3C9|nr:TRAP transporter small permease [Hyphomicrobium sp.]HEX2840207.1 TRAP transporter small permease [Hyphomicrobium sp.]
MGEERAKAARILDHLEEIIIATLLAAATLLIFVAVAQRYGLSGVASVYRWSRVEDLPWLTSLAKSLFFAIASVRLTWAQELCIFMVVWMAKFGAAYGVRTGIHVGVDILVENLKGTSQRVLIVAGLLAGALFTVIIGTLGAQLVWHIYDTGQTSAVLELPMWLVYLAVPLGSYLMCYRFLEVAWHFWKTGERPHHDPGAVEGIEPVAGSEGAR